MLCNSGCVHLPSQRTLRDYAHFIRSHVGFSVEVDQQLFSSLDLTIECNSLVMDEVHIKADLVYDKRNGKLVGFVNLGETNNHLLKFESALANKKTDCSLATSMLVFIFCQLNFPYACHTPERIITFSH